MAIAADGGDDSVNAAVSAAALAAAVSLCLAAMYASDQRPRRRRLPAAALPPPTSGVRFEQSVLRFVRVLDLTLALIMFSVDFSCSSAASRSSCSS